MPPKNVVLIGMMGSGKTSTAKELAARLGYGMIDTDEIVERNAGATVQQIFDTDGEQAFRKLEAEAIQSVADWTRYVIACGGGAVLSIANVQALQKAGPIVYLRATADTLASRIDGAGRPLLKGDPKAKLERIATERSAVYRASADLVVDTDGLSPAQVAALIEEALSA